MAVYVRHSVDRFRREAREREKTRRVCLTHGTYNPWQRTLGGWRMGECPKCAAARYEASHRGAD